MKKLLEFLVKEITGCADIAVEEKKEGEVFEYQLNVPKDFTGLVIGKNGATIKAIRNILKIKATLEHQRFYINVNSLE